MQKRFKSVFQDNSRKDINCISSVYPRCAMSMANFISVMPDGFTYNFNAGERYQRFLNPPDTTKALMDIRQRGHDYLYPKFGNFFDDTDFFVRIFNNPEKARRLSSDWVTFFTMFYDIVADTGCTGLDLDFTKYLRGDEMLHLMQFRDCLIFSDDGRNPLNWASRSELMKPLLADWVNKAESAVKGNSVAADLRFGHDSGLSPFLSLIGIKGYDVYSPVEKSYEVWNASEMMPMGTNFQMIFYRHPRKAEVLVKMLFNEQETCIPALGDGPYYNWDDLLAYFKGIME